MTYLEKKIRNIIETDEINLGYFINEKVNDGFLGGKRRKELVKLLPLIIENTNKNNSNWIDGNNIKFIKTKGFLDNFIDNIDKFDFEDNDILNSRILTMFLLSELDDDKIKRLIDKLLVCNCTFDSFTMDLLWMIMEKSSHELKENFLRQYIRNEKSCSACIIFCNREKEYRYIISENIDFILNNIKNIDLFYIKYLLRDDKEVLEKIENRILTNKKDYVITTIKNIYNNFVDESEIDTLESKNRLETILEVVYLIIEDICDNEDISISNMNILSTGSFSSNLELGDKIIKIGCDRGTKTFHNNPYVNAMLLRKEFEINDDVSFFVEVNERVDIKSNISEEELYQLYKKVRDINLIWVDVAERNVGRLLKDNVIYWREELPLTDQGLGLLPYRGEKSVLKKGDIVILDNDLIFDDDTDFETLNEYSNPLQRKFEKRYQQEKKNNNDIELMDLNKMEIEVNQENLSPKK